MIFEYKILVTKKSLRILQTTQITALVLEFQEQHHYIDRVAIYNDCLQNGVDYEFLQSDITVAHLFADELRHSGFLKLALLKWIEEKNGI